MSMEQDIDELLHEGNNMTRSYRKLLRKWKNEIQNNNAHIKSMRKEIERKNHRINVLTTTLKIVISSIIRNKLGERNE